MPGAGVTRRTRAHAWPARNGWPCVDEKGCRNDIQTTSASGKNLLLIAGKTTEPVATGSVTFTAPDVGDLAPDLSASEIRARFRWARSRGHPRYLWPEIPIADWHQASKAIETAVAAVLRGESRVHLAPAARAAPGALGVAAFTSCMGPLLGRWIEDGRITAEDGTARLLLRHLAHGRTRAAHLHWELRRVLGILSSAGVDVLVLKGAHTGLTYFVEPGARPSADLDLFVEPACIGAATHALASAGYLESVQQRRPYKADWCVPGTPGLPRSLYHTHADDPFAIELHGSLERDFCGVRRVTLSDGIERTIPFPEVGPRARVLGQPELLCYLALHASEEIQNLTLLRLLELVLVIRRDAGRSFTWDDVGALLEQHGALRFAYPAFAFAERLAPGTVDARVLAALRADAPARARVVIEAPSTAAGPHLHRVSLRQRYMLARGPAEHMRRFARTLWPIAGGGSPRRLARIYAERVYEVLRGNVSIDGATAGPADPA